MEENNLQADEKQKVRSSKIRNVCSIVGSAFVGVVVLLAVILSSLADKIWDLNGPPIKLALVISTCAFVGCFLGGVLSVFIIKLCRIKKTDTQGLSKLKEEYKKSKQELSEVTKKLTENVERVESSIESLRIQSPPCKNIVDQLNGLMDFEKGKEYLINSHQVDELELSVSNVSKAKDRNIYIQSSSFTLETRKDESSLLPTIISNLRHAVKYIYIVPNTEKAIKGFLHMITEWWDLYSSFINDANKCKALIDEFSNEDVDSNYLNLVKEIDLLRENNQLDCAQIEQITNACLNRFLKLVELHISRECHLFVTVALYQKQAANGEEYTKYYDAIVKLPTSPTDTEKEYYAYRIPEGNSTEFGAFCKRFLDTYDRTLVSSDNIEEGYRDNADVICKLRHITSSGHKIEIIADNKSLDNSKFFLKM